MGKQARLKMKHDAAVASTKTEQFNSSQSGSSWEGFDLPKFNGERMSDLSEWISKLEAFFDFTGKPDDQRVLYAFNLLTGEAHAKWRLFLAHKAQVPATWNEFKAEILQLIGGQNQVEGLLSEVKQGGSSVTEYTQRFLEGRKMLKYIFGLNAAAAEFVRKKNPKTFAEAVKYAEEWENENAPKIKTDLRTEVEDVDVRRCYVMYHGDDDYGVWLRGKVKGQKVTIAQSNNSDNFVTEKLVKQLGIPTTKCKPFKIEMPIGVSESVCGNSIAHNLEFELESGYKGKMDFAVMSLPRHDMLLGFPFFHSFESLIFGGGSLRFGSYTCKLYQGPPPL